MTIFSLAIFICVLSYYDVSSYTPSKCDITIWHMGVMEHLLSQQTEMTHRQKSTLEKVEQMIQRVTKNGESPLVNCGLLNTYSYNLAAEFSSQLMDLTIRESEERSGKSANDMKAARGGPDGDGVGPTLDVSGSSKENDNTLTFDYTEKKGTDNKRIYKQTIYEGGTDKDTLNDKEDANSDDVDKEPADGKIKDDVNESDDTEHRGDNMKTADRNPSHEFSHDSSRNNNRDDFSMLNDSDNDIGGVRDDEDNNGKDNYDKSKEGINSRSSNDIIGEKNDKNSDQHNEKSGDINTQNHENINNDKITDTPDQIDDAKPSGEDSASNNIDSDTKNNEGSDKDIRKADADNEDNRNDKGRNGNVDNDSGLSKSRNDGTNTKIYGDMHNDKDDSSGKNNRRDDDDDDRGSDDRKYHVDDDSGNNDRQDAGVNIKGDDRDGVQGKSVGNGDVSKEKDSLDSGQYYDGNAGKSNKYTLWEHGDEETDDNEEEDCYYRSADEFVCTRKTRDQSNDNDISKITNENIKLVDENNDENKDDTLETDDKITRFDEDLRAGIDENNNNDNGIKMKQFSEDDREDEVENIDADDGVKRFDEDIRGHKDEITNTDDNIGRLDEDDQEYKHENIDTDYKTERFHKAIHEENDESNNNDKDDDDKINIFNKDSNKAESKYLDDDEQLTRLNEDDNDNIDKTTDVKNIPFEEESHETGNDDKYKDKKIRRFAENISVDQKEHVQSSDDDALTDKVIGRGHYENRNVNDKLKRSNANDFTKERQDNVNIDVKQTNVGDRDSDNKEIKSPLNSNENEMAENNNGDENGVTENNKNDGDRSVDGDVESINSNTLHSGLDTDSEEYSSESLAVKDVSTVEAEKSNHNNNVIVTTGNDNSDGTVIFHDNDDNDDDEEIKLYDFKGDQDITFKPQTFTGDQESLGSESDINLNDIDTKYKIDDNNSDMTNIDGGSRQDVIKDESEFVSSIDDSKKSYLLKQPRDDKERNTVTENQEETIYRSSEEKRGKENEELSGNHRKHTKTASKITSEEARFQRGQTLADKKPTVEKGNNDYSTLDMKQLEFMFAQRESEQAAKIQELELMLVKLENKILTQSANTQSDTNILISLENQILKLENELMKLSQNYHELQRNHDTLKSQQRKSYLELEHIKTSPRNPERSALADNSTSEMMKHQNTRIVELSKMINHQSATAQMLQSRSKYLEEENRKLFQVVLNQTALISSIMRKLDELGKEELKTKIQTADSKAQSGSLKQSQTLRQDTQKDPESLKQATYEYEFGMDYSLKAAPPVQSKDLVSIVLFSFRRSPSAGSPFAMLDLRWRCGGLNSTRICLFHSLIISNCTPFNDLQWKACKQAPGSLLLRLSDEKGQKHGDNVLVHLSSDGQMPGVKHDETAEASKLRAQLGASPKDIGGSYNNDKDNEVMPTVVSVLDDKKHGTPRRSEELELDGDNSNARSDHSFRSEPDEISAVKSTSSDEQSRKDGEGDKMTDSLIDFSDVIRNGRTADNEVQEEGRRSDIKVIAFDRNEDDNSNNNIMFKSGDSDTFEESKKKDNVESSIQEDTNNRLGVLQTKYSSLTTGAEATAKSPCGHNDLSPECNRDLAQRSKPPSDNTAARPELNEQGQLTTLNIDKKEDNTNVHRSTAENDEQTAQMKILEDNENKMRKKAAEEAMKTHEALYRNILYKPIYDNRPKDCYELYKQGQARDGLHQIFVSGLNVYVTVYCDMAAGGWTLLLKREDGLVDFYRNYEQYKEGFGAPRGEHYIGNEVIHHLTNQGHYSLKVDLTDWNGTTRHAHYDHFWVDGEEDDFRLHLFGYSGDAGDGLGKHSGMKFSTFDVDNDLLKDEMGGSCAKRFQGAGWYYKCYSSNLLGRYYPGGQIPDKRFDGIAWKPWRGPGYSLKCAVLAVRPFGAE